LLNYSAISLKLQCFEGARLGKNPGGKNRGTLSRVVYRSRRQAVARVRLSLDQRPVAHFLHIEKTAGTAVQAALRQAHEMAKYRLIRHPHEVGLPSVPEADRFFFCVRDPIDRYRSGFLSRQREGRPRYYIPWSGGEAEAFARFPSPDALAVSLSAGGTEQRDAEAAMGSILNVRSSYWDTFRDPDYFRSRADDILWIGRQESLDLGGLAAVLGLARLELPTDPVQANRNPQPKTELSDLARQNLREWYAKDYLFLELCDELDPARHQREVDTGETDRTFIGRVMSQRPFALHNKDALRLARVAGNSSAPRWLLPRAVPSRHR
jgi:hypothetical protein